VIAGWQAVWEYFLDPARRVSAFTTDFELYDPSAIYEVRICVAVM
jgi:hypothetical protein